MLDIIKKNIDRTKIFKNTKYKESEEKSHLSNVKKPKEVDYEYYICDYCNKEIKISTNWEEKDGGIIELPYSISNSSNKVRLCLHNSCFKKILPELQRGD